MKHQWNIGVRNKYAVECCHSDLFSVYKCEFAHIPMSKINLFIKQLQTTSSLKPLVFQFLNFRWSMIWLQGLSIVKLGLVKTPRWPLLLKIGKTTKSTSTPEPSYMFGKNLHETSVEPWYIKS